MEHTDKISREMLMEFILSVGYADTFAEFADKTILGLKRIIPFDQSLVQFFDANSKARDAHMVNYDRAWYNAYMEYYSKIDRRDRYKFELASGMPLGNMSGQPSILFMNWTEEPKDEYMIDFVRAQGIKFSCNFHLCDRNNVVRASFSLNRLEGQNFTAAEKERMRFLIPHLNNIHKKFFALPSNPDRDLDRKNILIKTAGLTKRETEIVLHLCNGISPPSIGKLLHITPSTTHKHLTQIYKKMKVSSLQELLVYLLNPSAFR